MTDPDERIINHAIVFVDDDDKRENARAALHRLFRDRRKLEAEVERLREEYNVLETSGWPGTAEDWLHLRHLAEAVSPLEAARTRLETQYEQQQAFRHQDDRELTRLREENERLRGENEALTKALAIVGAESAEDWVPFKKRAWRAEARLRRIEEAASEAYVWLSRPRTEEMLAETPAQTENQRLAVIRALRAALADQPTVPDPVEETDERSVRNEPVSPDEWGPPLADQPTEETS